MLQCAAPAVLPCHCPLGSGSRSCLRPAGAASQSCSGPLPSLPVRPADAVAERSGRINDKLQSRRDHIDELKAVRILLVKLQVRAWSGTSVERPGCSSL